MPNNNHPSKPDNLHVKDKKPVSVRKRIEEFTAKFETTQQETKPPTSFPQKSELTSLNFNGRRPSEKEMGGQAHQLCKTIVQETRLVNLKRGGDC